MSFANIFLPLNPIKSCTFGQLGASGCNTRVSFAVMFGSQLGDQCCVLLSFGISSGLCTMMDTEVFGDNQEKAHYQLMLNKKENTWARAYL